MSPWLDQRSVFASSVGAATAKTSPAAARTAHRIAVIFIPALLCVLALRYGSKTLPMTEEIFRDDPYRAETGATVALRAWHRLDRTVF
jgi:hypothetical protein